MKRLDVMDIDQVDLVFTGNLSITGGKNGWEVN
jgi:hypothetical protein